MAPWVAVGCLILALACGRQAWAQAAADDATAELEALERQLEADIASLATADCTVACLALESMIRSAERICVLEPGGARCAEARRKVTDAKRRVRGACPDCAAAAAVKPAPPSAADTADERIELEEADAAPAGAPPPADARGGCAACAIAEREDAPLGLLVSLLAVVLTLLRRARGRRWRDVPGDR